MRVPLLTLTAVLASAAEPAIRDIDGKLLSPFATDASAMAVFFVCTDCPIANFYAPGDPKYLPRLPGAAWPVRSFYEDVKADVLAVRHHLAEYGYRNIPAAIDVQRDIAKRAGATVTPEAVLIDSAGRVRYRGRINNFFAAFGRRRRVVTEHDLRDAIEAMLAGKPVAVLRPTRSAATSFHPRYWRNNETLRTALAGDCGPSGPANVQRNHRANSV